MRRYTNILFLISVLIYQFNLIHSATENVICLYQFVASTRPNKGNYLPKNIDPKLCTHINYFYVNLEIDGSLVIINKDTFQDHINQLQNLKSINPNVKLLLTVGGPLTMDDTFPIIAQDDELINNLIKTLTTFLKDNRFDGIEINWVYPTKDQSDIFLNFMTKIRDAFSVDKYILQVCVYPYPTSLGYKAKELSKVVDGINILTYDLLSPYMTFTSGNANLYSPSTSNKYLQQFNVDRSILSWLTIGVDTEKVNLAIPFYGNTYKLVVPANHQIGSNSSGPGVREQYTQSIGFAGFNEICEFHSDATHDWDDSVKTAFLYKDRLWIGYDDTKSVEIKVKYAIEQKLGGIVAWSIDTDDLTGACGEPNGLLKTINKVLKRIKFLQSKLLLEKFKNDRKNIIYPICRKFQCFSYISCNGYLFILFFFKIIFITIFLYIDKVICYYASWAYVREGNGKFLPEDIDPNLCTHVLYSFLGLQPNGSLQLLDPWFDVQLDGLNRVSKLKEKNPNFKCILSLGGWNAGGATFTAISKDPAKIKVMADSAIEFIKKYNFDGLDIDWEYPLANEKENFVNLLSGIKEAFKPHNYLLTIAVSAIPTDHGYDPKKFSEILDIINVMTYDFHGGWNDVTGQNSPLYASKIDQPWQRDNLNGNSSITHWIEQGADPQKLAIGMGFYGHSFTLADPNNNGLGAKVSGPGPKGPYTKTDGSLGYNELCEFHKNGKVVFDNEQKVPYLYEGNFWIGYDNEQSVQEKVKYAKSKNLGGVMIWSIETDDLHGFCGTKKGLLNAIKKAL